MHEEDRRLVDERHDPGALRSRQPAPVRRTLLADKDAIKRELDRKALRAELKKLDRDMERKADGRALLDETMPSRRRASIWKPETPSSSTLSSQETFQPRVLHSPRPLPIIRQVGSSSAIG